jgi:hypothetical protein
MNEHTPTFTAPVCVICAYPEEPELVNVTLFEDVLPRWTIGWQCPNMYIHVRMKMEVK